MMDDQAEWWRILSKLQDMLRKAARTLHEAGKMTRENMHNYFMSGTKLVIVLHVKHYVFRTLH